MPPTAPLSTSSVSSFTTPTQGLVLNAGRLTCVKRHEGKALDAHVGRMLPGLVVVLGLAIATMFLLSDNLDNATMAGMALGVLVALVAVVALWAGREKSQAVQLALAVADAATPTPPVRVEPILTAKASLLDDDDSGWMSLSTEMTVAPLQAEPPTSLPPLTYYDTSNMALDSLQLFLVASMGILLTIIMSHGVPDSEIQKVATPEVQTVAAPK